MGTMQVRSYSLVLVLAALAPITLPSCITTTRVATGFTQPVFATAPKADVGRLFVVEKGGRIWLLNLSSGARSSFLDLRSLVSTVSEQGLLGLAFHPDFADNGLFYVNYTATDGASNIVEYHVQTGNPDVADPASARLLLRIPQPQANHNGGWLGFNNRDDAQLYISVGDGGGGNDDDTGHTLGTGNAQDIDDNLLGKILKIFPQGDDFPLDPNKNYVIPANNPFVGIPGDDEIWAYGLRNPWRNSFDRQTGDLWIADVGQDAREEVNFQLTSSMGGENYGWRLREGSIANPTPGIGGPTPPGNVNPLYDYSHGNGQFQGNSVTGGYVYRGPLPELQGKYFFADYVKQKVWSLTRNGSTFSDLTDWTADFQPDAGSIGGVTSFAEDASGNLFILDIDGEIFQIVKTSAFAKTATTVQRSVSRVLGRK